MGKALVSIVYAGNLEKVQLHVFQAAAGKSNECFSGWNGNLASVNVDFVIGHRPGHLRSQQTTSMSSVLISS